MPIYQVQGPDGSIYDIEGPAGASQRQLIATAQAYAAQQRREELARQIAEIRKSAEPPPPPPETTFGGNVGEFFKGIIPGAAGLLEASAVGTSATLPEEQEKALRARAKETLTPAKEAFAPEKGYEESVGRKLGEAVGSTLPFFGLAALGPFGWATGLGLGVSASAGEARQRAEAKGITGDERAMATALGIGPGLLDVVAPQLKIGKTIITRAFLKGGVEGATEAAQQVSQNLIAKGIYDPEQEIFVGAGEEGAYGAGAGALTSMLIDLTLGRKARGAGAKEPKTEPKKEPIQGEMFPAELAAAQQAIAERQGPPAPEAAAPQEVPPSGQLTIPGMEPAIEQGELFTREGKPTPEATVPEPVKAEKAAEPAPIQGELPLVGGRTAVQQQIEQKVGAENLAQLAELERQANVIEREEKLQMLSEIENLDARVQAAEEMRREQARLDVLLPLIEDPQVRNIPKTFLQQLRDMGYQNPVLNDRERNLINKAYDIRLAEIAPTPEVTPLTRPLTELEQAIPEKTEAKEPEQLGIPGIGKRLAPEGAVEPAFAEPAFSSTLTPEILDRTGLPKQSGFYRQLVNKDVSIPEQANEVKQVLADVRANPRLSPATKQGVEGVAMQAFGALAVQGEMFGPRGGVKVKEAPSGKPRKPAPVGAGETVSEAGREGAGVSGKRRGAAAKEPTPSEPSGLGGAERGAAATETRKGQQPTAVKEEPKREEAPAKPAGETVTGTTEGAAKTTTAASVEKPAPAKPKAAAPKEPKAPGAPKAAEPVAKKRGRPAKAKPEVVEEEGPLTDFAEVQSVTYTSYEETDPTPAADAVKVQELLEAPPTKLTKVAQAARIYMGKMSRVVDNIINVAFDVVYDPPLFRREGEGAIETAFFRGTSGANARLAFEWINKNLSNEAKLTLQKYIYKFEEGKILDTKVVKALTNLDKPLDETTLEYVYGDVDTKRMVDLIKEGRTEEEAYAQVMIDLQQAQQEYSYLKRLLQNEIVSLGFPLHPGIQQMLKDGDLMGAMASLAGRNEGVVSRLAAKLSSANMRTRVEVQDNLVDDTGKAVPGYYDPTTDTIYMDSKTGMVPHVLLHEGAHAATSHVLDNPSNPVTIQLKKLYNDVKDSLDTAYGAQSLDEFVAEAFSNPQFQQKLASINPNGSKITAWQRFVNTVSNFLRRMVGMNSLPIESAFSQANSLIESILSPAPESRNGGKLFAASLTEPSKIKQMFDGMLKQAESLPGLDTNKINKIHELFAMTMPDTLRRGLLSTLPLNALADISAKYIPRAKELNALIDQKSGSEANRNKQLEADIKIISEIAAKNPEQNKIASALALEASRAQVNPLKDRKRYEKDPEKLADYDDFKSRYDKLTDAGKQIYNDVAKVYSKMYDEIKRVVGREIDETVPDKEQATKAKKEFFDLLTDRAGLDPYYPFERRGDYWLSYNAPSPKGNIERYVQTFETARERKQFMEFLDGKEGVSDIEAFSKLSKSAYRNAPSSSFAGQLMKVLTTNKVDGEVQDQVIRLILSNMPVSSFAQSFNRREGTLGFNQDIVDTLSRRAYGISRQLANIEYASKLSRLKSKMEEDFRAAGSPEEVRPYLDEVFKHADFGMSPDIPKWSKIATSFGFGMTLGFNVSSALVQTAQIPLVVYPYLSLRKGNNPVQAAKALTRAMRAYMGSGFEREVEGLTGKKVKMRAMFSLDNYDFADPNLSENIKRYDTLVRVGRINGQFNRSQMYDILDVQEGDKNILSKVNALSGGMLHHTERMNREISLMAAYDLELQRMKNKPEANEKNLSQQQLEERAAEAAIYLTEITNGSISAAAAPSIAQTGIGKVLFMYKRYGVSMYYMMFKTAKEAMADADPAVRRAAMAQLGGIFGSAALMAGVKGIPMFGLAAMVYNLLKGDDEDDFETVTRNYVGELPYKGILNPLTGLEISNRVGLSDLIFRDSMAPKDQGAVATLLELMGGPVIGSVSRMERGFKTWTEEGDFMRGMEQMLPAAIGNGLKAIRYGTQGANTLRGDPIISEVSPWNVGAQAFGFAPASYVRQLEDNANRKRVDRTIAESKTKLLRQYYMAARLGDQQGVKDVMNEIVKFNKKHPEVGIDADTIIRSINTHMKTTATMYHGIVLSPTQRARALRETQELEEDEYEI